MRIATYNINGIKARLTALSEWLRETAPDVVCLQEIKSVDEGFPREPLEDLGYNVETHGQKGFNGVAILSKRPAEDVVRGLAGDPDDTHARWIEASVPGEAGMVRVVSLYLPNGNPWPGPKFDYKINWMRRLKARAAALLRDEMPLVLAGDYNVIPEPRDAARPERWLDDALYQPEARAAWREILYLGFTDATRSITQAPEIYTFWDYQRGAWERNDGIRIDHMLISPQAADRLTKAGIDSAVRGRERPSDHVPVWLELDI